EDFQPRRWTFDWRLAEAMRASSSGRSGPSPMRLSWKGMQRALRRARASRGGERPLMAGRRPRKGRGGLGGGGGGGGGGEALWRPERMVWRRGWWARGDQRASWDWPYWEMATAKAAWWIF